MKALPLILALLPNAAKVCIYRRLLGWRIGRNVRIGLSYIDARQVWIGDNVRIGHFNRFSQIPHLSIGDNVQIHNGNTFLSDPDVTEICFSDPLLIIRANSYIIGPHFFDIQAPLIIGEQVCFSGRGSITYTHSIDCKANALVAAPITIGDHCCIGAGVRLAPGCSLPPRTVVGMGAVVVGSIQPSNGFIAGVPARVVRLLDPRTAYFLR